MVPEPDELLDLADEERTDVIAIARDAERSDLERLFYAWSRTTDEVARAREQRWVLEMALVRLAHRPPLVPVDDLVQRLVELEKRLGAGGGDSPRGPSSGGGGARSAGAAPAAGARVATGSPGSGPRMAGDGDTRAESVSRGGATAATASAPAWLARAQARATEPMTAPVPETRPSVRPSAPPPKNVPAVEMLDTRNAALALETWTVLVEAMDAGPVAIFKHAVPLEANEQCVRIAFEVGSFYARKMVSGESEAIIAAAAERALGKRPVVEIVQGALPEDAPTIARRDDARRAEARAKREDAARNHPIVRSFLEHVGGEIRGIKVED